MAKPGKLHEADLANFFTKISHHGAATMPTADFMRWMEWEKQTAGFWADVQERFQNALRSDGEEEYGWRLFTWQNEAHLTLLCFDPDPVPPSEEAAWASVSTLAQRPTPGRRKQPQPVAVEEE